MGRLSLSFAMSRYDRIEALVNGEVRPSGVELVYEGMPGGIAGVFYDQMKFSRYDVSEMSLSSFLVERARGWPYRMLPVFHNRNCSYTDIYIRLASGIRPSHPEDLRGKRFAIRDYQQSAGLWIRGVLEDEYGIRPQDLTWYQTRRPAHSHTGLSGLKLPVELRYSDTDSGQLLLNGSVDASWGPGVAASETPSLLARRDVSVASQTGFARLFPDPLDEAFRYVRAHGYVPPHHITVVSEQVLEQHPWVAASLMAAFEEAKMHAERRRGLQTLFPLESRYPDRTYELIGGDPNAYGIGPNSQALLDAQRLSVGQGLTKSAQPWSELYAEEVLLAAGKVPADVPRST